MVKSRQVDVVEIPTEQLAYIPGSHADRFATFGRWSGAWRATVVAVISAPPIAPRASSAWTALGTVGNAGPTFRRLIDVPGTRLALVLGAWWQQAEHDDGHLRLDAPCPVGEAWSLTGAFRRTLISRWLPVELLLSPHLGPWTLLELMPRPRSIRTRPTSGPATAPSIGSSRRSAPTTLTPTDARVVPWTRALTAGARDVCASRERNTTGDTRTQVAVAVPAERAS